MNKTNSMSIGKLAKTVNVSIRTLQYYDQIGLLKPTMLTEGGRRMYTSQDITVVHQILTLKSLGFSLEDIKQRLMPVRGPKDIVQLLQQQSEIIQKQIAQAQRLLESVELLTKEIHDTNEVNWYKYSNMVKLIGENNEYYWVVKHLDSDILTNIIHEHEHTNEGIPVGWWQDCLKRAIELQQQGVEPESEAAQQLASDWWHVMQKYSKGDEKMLGKLVKFYQSASDWPEEFRQLQQQSQTFMEKTIEIYIKEHQIKMPLQ